MDIKVNTNVNVEFERMESFSNIGDLRFEKVKIWLMHTGKNLNGSYFSKEDVENAIPSLANTPILGYIDENSDGEKDFTNHRSNLVRENGKWFYKYVGQAYGVIPETNNAKFEDRLCDDGVVREFLTCEGLIWTKWDDPIDILSRDTVKKQSMELHHDFEGFFDDENVFHFTKFKFFGACFLGLDYKTGMHNATVEHINEFQVFEEINNKIDLFKQFQLQKDSSEGGSEVDKTELLSTFNVTKEMLEEMGIDFEAITYEELEEKLKTVEKADEDGGTEDDTPAEKPDVVEEENAGDDLDADKDFALTSTQLRGEITRALNPNPKTDEWGWTVYDYWYVDHDDSTIFAYRESDFRLVGISYSMKGDFPEVDFASVKPFKVMYQPMDDFAEEESNIVPKDYMDYNVNVAEKKTEKIADEKFTNAKIEYEATVSGLREEVKTLKGKVSEYESRISEVEAEKRKKQEDEVFGSPEFAVLTDEDIQSVKDKASTMTIDEIKLNLFALVGMKNAKSNFSAASTKKNSITIEVDGTKKNKSGKPYSHIVDQYRSGK